MSFNAVKTDITLEASADLSAEQFRGVVINATGQAAVAGADAKVAGILQNNPDAAGQSCVVQYKGIARCVVDGALAAGIRVYTDASGNLSSTGTNNPVGTTVEVASGAGSIIAVLLD